MALKSNRNATASLEVVNGTIYNTVVRKESDSEIILSGRSLVRITNSKDIRTAPWGTPELTGKTLEVWLFI